MRELDTGDSSNSKPRSPSLLVAGVGELYYGLSHVPNSFRQHLEKDSKRGQAFLSAVQVALFDSNPYCTKTEILSAKHLSSGFHSAAYTFESTTGEWVMKVGMAKSPIRAPHPSSQEFTVLYASALDIQREIFQRELPHLIPKPQSVLHVQTENYGGTTIILQPFILDIKPLSQIGKLLKDEQQTLSEELHTFGRLCKVMEKKYEIRLDFILAGGHFVIGQVEGERHIVFLDNGPFVKELTPVFYEASNFFRFFRLQMAQSRIKLSRKS